MVNNKDRHLNDVFIALSDSTRRAMLAHLAKGQCNVSELPNPYKVSKAAISKHLKILHRAKLVDKNKCGREIQCNANLKSLDQAQQLLENLGQYWQTQLNSLEEYFNKKTEKETKDEHSNKRPSKLNDKKNNKRKTRTSI